MNAAIESICTPQRMLAVPFRSDITVTESPRKNQLLAALPSREYARLVPNLEFVELPLGLHVHNAGDRTKHLYFITAGIVSRFYLNESGVSLGTTIAGNEGVVGLTSFLGADSTLNNAVVLQAGSAYRLQTNVLKSETAVHARLSNLLLRYTHALIAQTAQMATCNCYHLVEQRFCRFILMSLDRSPSNELTMSHELIADMLGVRREAVSLAAGKMQKAGLIRCGRTQIAVMNRAQVEARVCGCYPAMKREYTRLVPLNLLGLP